MTGPRVTFYNDNDPKAAAWLRELIKAGLIAPGVVDERSIADLKAADLHGYTQCHFFAGIGGWSYALRLAGWPDEEPVWTGSCPCQPLSCAGQRKGHADERHLWPAFYRLIAERGPSIVFGEQVAGPDGREWLAGVRADLEGIGYAVGGADLCAAGVGAPMPRQRLYWMAHAKCNGQSSVVKSASTQDKRRLFQSEGRGTVRGLVLANGSGSQPRRQAGSTDGHGRPAEPAGGSFGMDNAERIEKHTTAAQRLHTMPSSAGAWSDYDICHFTGADAGKIRRIEPGSFPLAHGVPGRVGLLRGYGNAIVPQVAAEFIQAAREALK